MEVKLYQNVTERIFHRCMQKYISSNKKKSDFALIEKSLARKNIY